MHFVDHIKKYPETRFSRIKKISDTELMIWVALLIIAVVLYLAM